MEQHCTDEEDHQRAILKEHSDAFRFSTVPEITCAAGEFIVNLAGSDQKQDQNRGDRESCHEEKDAAIGNEIAKEAHGHGGNHIPCRVERLIAKPWRMSNAARPTIPSDMAQMAGRKTLDVPPIKTCAPMTGQNDGNKAISRAPQPARPRPQRPVLASIAGSQRA